MANFNAKSEMRREEFHTLQIAMPDKWGLLHPLKELDYSPESRNGFSF